MNKFVFLRVILSFLSIIQNSIYNLLFTFLLECLDCKGIDKKKDKAKIENYK